MSFNNTVIIFTMQLLLSPVFLVFILPSFIYVTLRCDRQLYFTVHIAVGNSKDNLCNKGI